jgi:hypothetical protein
MTDRRLLPKLRTGCSTFFSRLPCSDLGDLFDRVGEAPEFVTVPAAEDSSRSSEAPSSFGRIADPLILDAILRTTLRVLNR